MNKPKYNVNLPKTNFPMKADLPKREPDTLAHWEKDHIYKKMLEKNASGPLFVLHDGPPYANGHIHMGHALNKILKDIIVKFKSMAGHRTPYVPGWDCHGLPIEHQLMKEKGWDKRKVGRAAFRKEAARYAEHFIDIQRKEFKRLGVLGEWEKPYKTLSPEYEASIARTFYDLLDKGCVYRDKKPVYWCASCETALAEAEIEYENKKSTSIFVKFPVLEWPSNAEAQAFAKAAGKRVFVLVWTTTPWTLPANVALAFHPEQTYRLWESQSGEKYLVGDPGWKFMAEWEGREQKDAPFIDGLSLEGLLCKNPLNNNESQGVLAEYVSKEEGTGVVHIAPGHGQEDYVVGREYGLPTLSPVDDGGRFTTDVLPNSLAGKTIWQANPLIVEMLEKSRNLVKAAEITHSYPHCWRCKNPIIFRAAEQWFLKVSDDFRKKLIESVDKVTWVPEYGKDRILGMLQTRPDWCLSRQRFWGAPIPMFYCEACKEPLKDKAVFDQVVALFKQHGSHIWFEKEAKDLLPAGVKCAKCGKTSFRKEEDILDVWFDSGVSWVAVLRETLKLTGRDNVMYLEGSDQHRGWFQTSLLPAVALTGEPPYQQVLTHGFVLDGQGRAMSKSLGNVIAPQEVIEKYGADIVRLWVAMTDYREDVRLSQDILDRVIDTYRKLRNTLRYLLGNLSDFKPQDQIPLQNLEPIDKAVLAFVNDTVQRAKKSYEASQFHMVSIRVCDDLCINLLSGYYLDIMKDVLYCDSIDSRRRRSAQTAFLEITKVLSKLLAPLISFTAEETWQTLKEQDLLSVSDQPESIFLNKLPDEPVDRNDKSLIDLTVDLNNLKAAINKEIEKLRQTGAINGANDAHVYATIHPDHLKNLESMLTAYMGVGKVTVDRNTTSGPFWVTKIEKAPGKKCDRCWIWREDVGADNLCARCAEAEKAVAQAAPAKTS